MSRGKSGQTSSQRFAPIRLPKVPHVPLSAGYGQEVEYGIEVALSVCSDYSDFLEQSWPFNSRTGNSNPAVTEKALREMVRAEPERLPSLDELCRTSRNEGCHILTAL